MQEIERTTRLSDGSIRRTFDRLVGNESPGLAAAFAARRKAAEDELDRGEVETLAVREHRRIGRNDPCPCGSQLKFKKCCGSRLDPNDPRIAD